MTAVNVRRTQQNNKSTKWWLWFLMGFILLTGIYIGRRPLHHLFRWAERRHFAMIGDSGPLLRLKAGSWKEHYSGLWTREMLFKRKRHWSHVKLQLLRVAPKRFFIKPWLSRKPRNIRWIMHHTTAIAAINGALFDPQFRPLGYFKTRKKIYNHHLHHRMIDGIFFQRKGVLSITEGKGWKPFALQTDWAFQSAPLLLLDGKRRKLPQKGWKVDRRSALCLDQKGHLIMMSTAGFINGLSFFELSLLMKNSIQNGGLGCQSGLNLDGGSSTQWAVRTPSRLLVTTGRAIPTYLLIMPLQKK